MTLKLTLKLTVLFAGLFSGFYAQSPVNDFFQTNKSPVQEGFPNVSNCGSFEYIKNQDHKKPGFLQEANDFMMKVKNTISNLKSDPAEIIEIPIVFHIVHNNEQENIPDSVIINQVAILNESYRRNNADTVNMRPEFSPYVGDSKIQFKLAEIDPNGNPTNGITRTYTPIEHFGGILPYGQGQDQQIVQWITDSLYFNLFRLTSDGAGGKNAWDINRYLNVWVGDLRIFEPQFNNMEEVVFFGLATPPQADLNNWPDSLSDFFSPYEQGVLMHYVNIGSNNPNVFPSPYNVYNGIVTTGKLLVHEVGHYLGLRHIWGDGDCSVDDFINDTPNSSSQSNWSCDLTKNTCVDNIDGIDLPDMVENYMDYSSGNCQNSFTKGQINFMRYVLENHRTGLNTSYVEEYDKETPQLFTIYPNPATSVVHVKSNQNHSNLTVNILNLWGQKIQEKHFSNIQSFEIPLENQPKGIYFIEFVSNNKKVVSKIIKQ